MTRELRHLVDWTDNPGAYTLYANSFWTRVIDALLDRVEGHQPAIKVVTFRSEAPTIKDCMAWGGELLLESGASGWHGWLVKDRDGRLMSVRYDETTTQTEVDVYSHLGDEDAEMRVDELRERIPKIEPPTDDKIRMVFWALSPNGSASSWDRKVIAPLWEEVRDNYPANVVDEMDQLHAWEAPPAEGGRLLLLHGPPGTGKTSMIRSLGRAWKKWCSFQFVLDPEKFFGEAFYMLQLLLQDTAERRVMGEANHWRLLVIEDADELLTADAKRRQGQALSRLLNICDGLVGQGLNIMVLITTNEPVKSMHPAVVRPGRCLVDLHVRLLDGAEANDWRRRHNLPLDDNNERATLAQLYDELRKVQVRAGKSSQRIGFKGRA